MPVPTEDLPAGLVPAEDLPDAVRGMAQLPGQTQQPASPNSSAIQFGSFGSNYPRLEELMGAGPGLDVVGRLKQMLTSEPPAFARPTSPLFKPIDDAMRGAADALLPGSIPEAAIQAGIGWGMNKLAPVALERGLRAFKATRPLAKEVAVDEIGNLVTPKMLESKAWYKAAGNSDKTIPITTDLSMAADPTSIVKVTTPHTFNEALQTIQDLRGQINQLMGEKTPQTAKAYGLRQELKKIEEQINLVFPGFNEAKVGMAQLKQNGLIQEMVNKKGPLAAFEADIAKGRIQGPAGTLLEQGGNKASRFLQPGELKEIKGILEKLGPEPGNSLIRQMVEGRALGGTIGGALGYQHGGVRGAAEGAAAGITVPATINWLIRQGLTHPATRALLKQGLERQGGLTNPITWQILTQLGTRLGMDMISPEQHQAEQQAQARQQGMQMIQQLQQQSQQQQSGEGGGNIQ